MGDTRGTNTHRRAWLVASLACAAFLAWAGPAEAVLPTDPEVPQSTPLTQIRLGTAFDHLARPLVDVPVVVADTGLDLDHPDIAPRLFTFTAPTAAPEAGGGPGTIAAGAHGWDMIGDPVPLNETNCQMVDPLYKEEPDSDPSDPPAPPCTGHGTLVAGVLGAAANNGIGSAGVAPNARFIAIRSCWDFDNCYGHVQPPLFRWAGQLGVRVVTMSWSGGPNPDARRGDRGVAEHALHRDRRRQRAAGARRRREPRLIPVPRTSPTSSA